MKLIKFEDEEYPKMLRKIKNPPVQIWIEGNIDVLYKKSIAIVGSRKCTQYGIKWCEYFAKSLIEFDLAITSGLAYGIDSVAHGTTLKYGGKTIAVLPSGLNNIYPKENIELYNKILKSGGVAISEYSPNEGANKYRFVERNRIVSGLSIGTLVVEAALVSGTSITARITREDGKSVFCVPGSLDNPKSCGTNNLIKKGAKLVSSVQDIVDCYDFLFKNKNIIIKKEEPYLVDDVDEKYMPIYKYFSNTPVDINTIIKFSNKNIGEIMSTITMLEIDGKIKNIGGNKFVKC